MSMMRYTYDYNGMRYTIDAPADATAADLQAIIDGSAKAPAQPAAPPARPAQGTMETAPLKEVEPAGIFEYFTNREEAIRKDREYRAYLQDKMQRTELEDIKTQTGFFDRLGDLFSRGLLSARSGIKDVEAAIETDPALKKQFTQEARRFAVDAGVEIKGATTEQDVKDNFLRNVIPYIIEKGAESLPQMIASTNPLGVLGAALPSNIGSQAREAAQLQGREDVTLGDVGRVAPGAVAVTALDTLGLGGILAAPAKTALGRAGKAALLEGSTEAIQSAIEYANPRVVTGSDVDAGELFEQAAFGALAGAGIGGGLRGAGELVSAPFRKEAEPAAEPDVEESPAVQQEYMRLVSEATAARLQAEPNLTQRQAFDQVVKDADKLYQTAITNVVGGAEADVDTGLDVSEGAGAGIPAAGAAAPSGAVPGAIAEPAVGGLAQPDLGVPPVEDRSAARVAPLEVEAFAPAVAAVQEAPNNKARKPLALQLVSDVVQAMPELQGLPKNKYNQAANQMVQAAARGEQFDPVAIVQGVAPKVKVAPTTVVEPAPALELPAAPAAPAIDGVAVAPVKAAIEAAAAPAPVAPGVVPSLAQSAARELGITPTVAPPPAPVAATPAAPAVPAAPAPAAPPEVVAPEVAAPEAAPTVIKLGKSKEGPAKVVAEKLFTEGMVNPLNEREVVVEGGGIQGTAVNTDTFWLKSLRAIEPGGGRRALSRLTQMADEAGVAIELTPEPFAAPAGKEMTPTELSDWYAGFGFEAQPDGTMVRPAGTPPSATITPEVAATPQQIIEDIEQFARSEAEDRGFDPGMFTEGARDAARGVEPLSDNMILESQGQEALGAYKAGIQFGRERVAEAQAAPTMAPAPTPSASAAAAPPGAPPVPPAPPPTGGPPPGQPGPKKQPKVVSKGKEVKLTQAQTRTALEKATATRRKLNRIQQRIANTNKTADVVSGQIELGKLVRGDKENWALLRGVFDTLDVGKWRTILPALSTEDIFRVLKGRLPGLTEADRIIRQDMTRYETKEYLALADELEQIGTFLQKHPKAAQALSDLQFASVAYQVDPSLASNAQEYADKFDKKTRELRAELGKTPVTDAKKQRSLKTKLDNRFREIKSVYEGAVLDDGRVYGWRDLARPELGANRGKDIFKRIRDAHRKDLEASYQAIRSRLMETKEGEKLDEALEKLEKQFKAAREQTIYFPAMRFGQFYARVGTGANSIFKMFETETKRNQFVQLMRERGEEVTETGNVEDLRNDFQNIAGGPLKEVLDLFEDNPRDIGALRGQVFDLWLQTLSSGDMRKHMAPRKMRAGYSTDILKNFANFRRASINSTKRAQFGYKLRNEISRASDGIAGLPDQAKMQEFIKEIELRVMSDLTPPERGGSMWQQAVEFGNKMAFYQYLANPKTAIIQLTQLHIVAFPMLAQKYGTAKAGAALAKYGFSSLGGFVTSPLKAIKRENGSFTFDWEQPNLLDNPISALKQESDPELYEVLSEGWQEGRDLNLWMDTFANDIGGYGMADPDQRTALQELAAGRPLTATLRGATFAFEAMGTLMHQMERVNREATYMAALELEYREARKAGKSHVEAKKAAIEKAADTTLAATFDFSAYNKPRVLTMSLGRIAGQFFTYPYMMTSLLARNMYTAIKMSGLEPGERSAAIKVATGSLVNISLYAGLTGVPLYGIFKAMGFMLSALFGDDEEEGLRYVDENGNVRFTYNVDWWFRNVWIPEFFGPDGTVASLLGISDETAATLALAAEKGPISAITDIDLSNSVALDFLFFLPQESRAETPEGKFVEYTFNVLTGAFGGTVLDYIKAGRDVATGYSDRALEKLPKLFSNVAKANRFGAEGQLSYAGELSGMDKDFWTSDKQILLSLGFNSTEAAQRQQQNYEGREITKKIEKSRNDVLAKFRKVAIDVEKEGGMTDAIQPDLDDAYDAARKFNEVHPQYMIGPDTVYEAQMNAILKMRESRFYEGVPIDKRGRTPYLEDILRRRTQPEEVE
jgi:hypothetical protein